MWVLKLQDKPWDFYFSGLDWDGTPIYSRISALKFDTKISAWRFVFINQLSRVEPVRIK